MPTYRKSYEVVAFTYEADIHCPLCTVARFPSVGVSDETVKDNEGNDIHPVFLDQIDAPETCGDCHATID